ncbi:hypothetical protein Purlil1_1888 [Purpureocillium lilacinum]|uniref:Mitochondrial import inner membrane translocase subunit TIM22 n=2 Tax=Purpureocillium lilacinum TaxID=33203 RepID=A0ABR0CB02_PURLI|nr:hypothetical protein Purlil1_1888 [Purpureocillium lilacinum]
MAPHRTRHEPGQFRHRTDDVVGQSHQPRAPSRRRVGPPSTPSGQSVVPLRLSATGAATGSYLKAVTRGRNIYTPALREVWLRLAAEHLRLHNPSSSIDNSPRLFRDHHPTTTSSLLPTATTEMNGFPSSTPPAGGSGAGAMMPGGASQDPNVRAVQAAMESCLGKSVMSGVMGFGMGGLFGMFMASMSYDTPFGSPVTNSAGQNLSSMPLRQQLKMGFKDMGTRSYSMAKNFGKVGALFSGIECGIEGLRAKNDLANGVAAGCLTGAILAKNTGPTGMAGGCAAFAAFSAAIDAWMRQPKED